MNGLQWQPRNTKVSISIAHEEHSEKRRDCSITRVGEICASLFYGTINFFSLLKTGPNIAQMQNTVLKRDPVLPKMEFLSFLKIPTFYFANHPSITEAMFKPHRDGSLYLTDNESPDSIFQLISKMLNDPLISKEDLVFTCSSERTTVFRSILNSILSPRAVQELWPAIEETVQETIDNWGLKHSFNLTEECHLFTCAVLTKVLLGIDDENGKLAHSMNVFFDYISSTFLKKPIDANKVHLAKETFFQMVDLSLEQNSGISGKLQQQLTIHEKKMLFFSLFFAGTDSTVSSLVYCLLKCAQSPSLQEEIRLEMTETHSSIQNPLPDTQLRDHLHKSIIKKTLAEGLRVFTPVIGVTRIAREDLTLKMETQPEPTIRHIPKGARLAPSQNLAARCPMLFPEHPNEFDPHRYNEVKNLASLPWAPFGSGTHACPGAALYQLIAHTFVGKLLSKGQLATELQNEPTQTGHFINKLAEPITVAYTQKPI